jgi:hypothetical protein
MFYQFDNSQVGIFEGTNTMSSALSLLQRNNHTQIESIPDWKYDVMTVLFVIQPHYFLVT